MARLSLASVACVCSSAVNQFRMTPRILELEDCSYAFNSFSYHLNILANSTFGDG
jgi:hypothetical protein